MSLGAQYIYPWGIRLAGYRSPVVGIYPVRQLAYALYPLNAGDWHNPNRPHAVVTVRTGTHDRWPIGEPELVTVHVQMVMENGTERVVVNKVWVNIYSERAGLNISKSVEPGDVLYLEEDRLYEFSVTLDKDYGSFTVFGGADIGVRFDDGSEAKALPAPWIVRVAACQTCDFPERNLMAYLVYPYPTLLVLGSCVFLLLSFILAQKRGESRKTLTLLLLSGILMVVAVSLFYMGLIYSLKAEGWELFGTWHGLDTGFYAGIAACVLLSGTAAVKGIRLRRGRTK